MKQSKSKSTENPPNSYIFINIIANTRLKNNLSYRATLWPHKFYFNQFKIPYLARFIWRETLKIYIIYYIQGLIIVIVPTLYNLFIFADLSYFNKIITYMFEAIIF